MDCAGPSSPCVISAWLSNHIKQCAKITVEENASRLGLGPTTCLLARACLGLGRVPMYASCGSSLLVQFFYFFFFGLSFSLDFSTYFLGWIPCHSFFKGSNSRWSIQHISLISSVSICLGLWNLIMLGVKKWKTVENFRRTGQRNSPSSYLACCHESKGNPSWVGDNLFEKLNNLLNMCKQATSLSTSHVCPKSLVRKSWT